MFAEVRRITGDEAEDLNAQFVRLDGDDLLALRIATDRSNPALGIFMGNTLVAMLGFIPTAILGGTAYAWLQPAPEMVRYKIGFVRMGRAIFTEIRKQYPIIIGHCSLGSHSEAWLRSCGARFIETNARAKPYIIGDS